MDAGDEGYEHLMADGYPRSRDRGWIALCECGWESDPQDSEDDAEDEHSGHCNAMARQA